jgi:hypothetical protein
LSRNKRAGKTRGHDQRHRLCAQHPPCHSAGRNGADAGLDKPVRAIPLLSNVTADSRNGRHTIRRKGAPNGLELPASRGKNGDGVSRRS